MGARTRKPDTPFARVRSTIAPARTAIHQVLALAVCLALAQAASGADPQPEPRVPDFSLPDAQGTSHAPAEYRAARLVVLLFLGAECPVSNGYSPAFRQLTERYSAQGVVVLGVHSDPTLSAGAAAEHAREYNLPFATLLDPRQQLARGCAVRVTPEAVVARPSGEILYRGRIDNKYSPDGKRRDAPTEFDLDEAIRALLADMAPKARQTAAFGCPLPEPRRD